MTPETSQALITSIRASLANLASASLSPEQTAELASCSQQLERLEEAVQRQDAALQEARQARTKFVSVVTHELRIPMTSIKGYTDLMRSGVVGPVNDQQVSFLNIIRNNVERMSALVSDLSDINYMDTGRLKLDLKPVSLSGCIENAMLVLKAKIEDKQQQFVVDIPLDLPQPVADANRVTQILSYLIGNANRYTPIEGHIRLCASQQGEAIRVEITDTGIGISPSDQAQLFKAFFRSEEAAVRDQPGWGLSLNVARRLVELMGGEMGVQSLINAGSTFWFTLPVSTSRH
jgi:signal transduction histidine kinase